MPCFKTLPCLAGAAVLLIASSVSAQISVLFDPLKLGEDGTANWVDMFDGPVPTQNDDVYITNQLPNETNIYFAQPRAVRSLSLDTDRALILVAKDNILNPALLVASGEIAVTSGGTLGMKIPTLIDGDAYFDIDGTLYFNELLYVNGDIRINNSSIDKVPGINREGVSFYSFIQAQRLLMDAGVLNVSNATLAVPQMVLGDAVGARPDAAGLMDGSKGDAWLLLNQAAATPFSLTIHADGILNAWESPSTTLHGLQLHGGQIRIARAAAVNLATNLVEASPGLLTNPDTGHESVWASRILVSPFNNSLDPAHTKVDLGGIQVEFRTQSAHGSNDALHVGAPLVNGSILKTGTGTLTLNGAHDHAQWATSIHAGAIHMQMTNNAIALPSDTTIGQGGSGIATARLISGGHNDIANDVVITILSDGQWRRRGFDETIGGLILAGGSVDSMTDSVANGTLTLFGDVQVQTNPYGRSSSINGRTSFGGGTRTFNVQRTAGAAYDLALDANLRDGTLVKTGDGILRLNGATASTLTRTHIQQGTLELATNANVNAVGDELMVGNTNQSPGGPTVRWRQNEQLDPNSTILFRSGLIDLNGKNETIGGINAFGTGHMNVTTGSGTLKLQGNSTAFQNSRMTVTGNVDLKGGTRNFDARGGVDGEPSFANFTFTGRIDNGTFNKTGVGTAQLSGVTGSAVLNISGGTARVFSTEMGGLSGGGRIEMSGGQFIINDPAASNRTYSGVIIGGGQIIKRGQGTLTLNGNQANTFGGLTSIEAGILVLGKTNGPALSHVWVQPDAKLYTGEDNQFSANAQMLAAGNVYLMQRSHNLGRLDVDHANIYQGTLNVSNGIGVNGGMMQEITVDITNGGLKLFNNASAIALQGTVHGLSEIEGGSWISLHQNHLATGPQLLFTEQLVLAQDSRLKFAPSVIDADFAMLEVDGAMVIGDPLTTSSDATMLIDLTEAGSLAVGTYRLMDFSNAPYDGEHFVQLDHFKLLSLPEHFGSLSIEDNQLLYTVAIPEPGTLSLLGIASLLLIRRRTNGRL